MAQACLTLYQTTLSRGDLTMEMLNDVVILASLGMLDKTSNPRGNTDHPDNDEL